MITLPACDLTELPRLFCGCRTHNDGFTLTDAEHRFLDSTETVAEMFTTGAHRLVTLPEYTSVGYGIPAEVKVANSDLKCATNCGRTRDESVFVCAQCVENLEVALGDVPALLEDLRILAAKQARFTASGKGTDRSPLPFNPHAADRAKALENEIDTAVTVLCEHRGIRPDIPDTISVSRWLLQNVRSIALDQSGPDITTGILREHKRALRCIDRPPDALYIGNCTCGQPMYASEYDDAHRCRTCGELYEIDEQIAMQRSKIRTALLTTGQMEKAFNSTYVGLKVHRQVIIRIIKGRGLPARGHNREGDALYLASDILDVLEQRAS